MVLLRSIGGKEAGLREIVKIYKGTKETYERKLFWLSGIL